jgi:hypothetical protein
MCSISQHLNGKKVVLTLSKEPLPFCILPDKVLHIDEPFDQLCNTLSGAHYVSTVKSNRGHACFVRAATVLEDQPPGRRTPVRCAISPAFSGSNRLLQQDRKTPFAL